VIFVTVGSTQFPFPRLMRALTDLPGEELFVQHGPIPPPANVVWSSAYMQFPEVVTSMERADAVVCHAGAGSVLCALRVGHVPIVIPRLRRYRETVDDHQLEFARALAADGKVVCVDELDRLAELVAAARPRREPGERSQPPAIQAAVREALLAGPSMSHA
jgi:UDP-N-acetylglucosamine transferase subunit ALG13